MKNLLVMAGTGIGLFVATAVGLLGIQGRLNYAGTRGVPLLSSFFSKPEATAEENSEGQAPEVETEPIDLNNTNGGRPLLHSKVSIKGDAAESEEGEGHGESAAEEEVPDTDQDKQVKSRARNEVAKEYSRQSKGLHGDPGVFFTYPNMESPLTSEEIDGIYRNAKKAKDEVERRIQELEERELHLSQRERDVQDRAKALSSQMGKIDDMERELQNKVADFESKVLWVSKSEEPDLKSYAESLAAFEPKLAAELVRSNWKTEAGRKRISKALKLMDRDIANAILADMQVPEIKEILDNLLKVHRESEEGK